MQDQPLTAFTQADADQVKKIASIFEDVTQEEAAAIEARNDQLTGGAKQTKKEAGKQVTKESVINELTDRGHGKQTIEKLYELLDFDSGKAEITLTQMSLKADENVLKFSKDLQKMFEDKKTAQYFALEDSEKAALRMI
jgi:NADH:ubiquinone oxidoreductase subunit C